MGIQTKIWTDAVVICLLTTCNWLVRDGTQNAGLCHVLQAVRKMDISAATANGSRRDVALLCRLFMCPHHK